MSVEVESYKALFELLPEQLRPFIQHCLEGNVLQFALVYEQADHAITDTMPILDETAANCFAMVGALEHVKREYLRMHIKSRVEYVEQE